MRSTPNELSLLKYYVNSILGISDLMVHGTAEEKMVRLSWLYAMHCAIKNNNGFYSEFMKTNKVVE